MYFGTQLNIKLVQEIKHASRYCHVHKPLYSQRNFKTFLFFNDRGSSLPSIRQK